MDAIVIRNAMIWDGSGSARFPGSVRVEGRYITAIAAGPDPLGPGPIDSGGARVIDAGGMTLMPGLIDGHSHLSFTDISAGPQLGAIPPEEHTMLTAYNARTVLDAGFTAAFSAASAKIRLDVVVRNEIDAGRIPGPRLRACSPEITVTGGLGDPNLLHMARDSYGLVANGVDEITQAVRLCIREGVDTIKINISGQDLADAELTVMKEAEVRAAVDTAHEYGKKVAAHARASNSVIRAVRCGVDVIYHCDYANEEALDALESVKDHVICAPAIGLQHCTLYEAGPWGITTEMAEARGTRRLIELSAKTHTEMHKRGIPIAIGGDYGFAWNPQGTNARDIEHFVTYFGFTPNEALQAATRVGGVLMESDIGQIREGWLADLLLVDGDPVQDVTLLQDKGRLKMIMKDGALHKAPPPA
jgi:imidazolonepropionase-like amidohydrolase